MKFFIDIYEKLFLYFADNCIDLGEYFISFNYYHDSYCEYILHSFPFNSNFSVIISFCEFFDFLKNHHRVNIILKESKIVVKIFKEDNYE